MLDELLVGIAALLTSILSAVAGLGGGVILLLVIAQFVAPTIAIPIQGAIQLVSNGSRAAMLRSAIAWPAVGWASVLLLPATFLGVAVATSLPDDALRAVLAVFVLTLAWRPELLRRSHVSSGDAADRREMLLGVGAALHFLGRGREKEEGSKIRVRSVSTTQEEGGQAATEVPTDAPEAPEADAPDSGPPSS